MAFCAVLDACVLVPSTLRDVLLEIPVRKVYRPLWSEKIEEEVERTVLRLHALRDRDEEESRGYVKRLRRRMNLALPDAQVQGWETLLPSVPRLPDPGDRHVVAAALMGRADVIVTFNLKDFDDAALPGELFAQSPDEFLLDVLGLYPEAVRNVFTTVVSRTGRKGPRWSVNDLLTRLEKEELNAFVAACRQELTL